MDFREAAIRRQEAAAELRRVRSLYPADDPLTLEAERRYTSASADQQFAQYADAYSDDDRGPYFRHVESIEDIETDAAGYSYGARVTLQGCGHTIKVWELSPKARMKDRYCTRCERISNGGEE